ncbi:alpha-L-fucosidase 2 [Arthrobacter sp. PvP023]|uniref:glycoside hydrolase family 95 protein n=1 Tax=Micrococcaceae TaxID=1268 RepID=UPI001AEA4D30|nr:glycoside hydrolase family 95 protein [Arthrobacter sp. PvP023]MBP1134963.1 alpha-L-fucosidase 2 [Arthrobacter sp. PvP023]
MPEDILRYDASASDWLEALPLGNGRLGAMVFGGPAEHRFQLNDGTAWSGSPHSQERPPHFSREQASAIIADARRLVAAGEHHAAEDVLKALQHRHSQAFLPFADLYLGTSPVSGNNSPGNSSGSTAGGAGEISGYSRALDLSRAVATTAFQAAGSGVRVEAFASHDPSVLVISVDTELPAGLDLTVRLDSPLRVLRRTGSCLELKLPSDVAPVHDGGAVEYSEDDSLSLHGAVSVTWEHDGQEAEASDVGMAASGVRHAVVFVTTETTFSRRGGEPQAGGTAATAAATAAGRLAQAQGTGRAALLARHLRSHGELYGKARLRLDVPAWTGTNTAERLLRANAHPGGPLAADPGLAELLFNYGRYLLISSSRAGGTPATLQGIWNNDLPAPWSSNFTTNINLQMNYWGAEPTGLAECAEPLFALIETLQVTGARTAQEYYGARGWAVHHNSDIWGYSKPVGHGSHSPAWSFWPMAGLWLVRHLWEHLQFGGAGEFARDRAWPAIRGAAAFALDLLTVLPDGSVGTSPSTSPENSFATDSGERAAAGESSSLDLVLVRDVLTMLCTLAEDLGLEGDPVVAEAREALPRIPCPGPGRDGRVREWLADPPEWEPEHRHVSHLYPAYPGDAHLGPELEAAVAASLDSRGDESTGWSLAWKILLRARLRQPANVNALLRLFFRDMATDRGGQSGGLYPNLVGAHPPFQIDGNLGYVAGIAECLLQSHRIHHSATHGAVREIELLPALPPDLPDGGASGLRARLGIRVSLEWRAGRLAGASFSAGTDQVIAVRYGNRVQELHLRPHSDTVLNLSPWRLETAGSA